MNTFKADFKIYLLVTAMLVLQTFANAEVVVDPALSSTTATQQLNNSEPQTTPAAETPKPEAFESAGPLSSVTTNYELPSGWKFTASTPGFAYSIKESPNPGRPATSGYLEVMNLQTKETKIIDYVSLNSNRFIDADVVEVNGEAKVIWRKTTATGAYETVSIGDFTKPFIRTGITYDSKWGVTGISDPINGFTLSGYYKGARSSGDTVKINFTSGEVIAYKFPPNLNQIVVMASTVVAGIRSETTFEYMETPRQSKIQNVTFYSAQGLKTKTVSYQYNLTTEQNGFSVKVVPPYDQLTTTIYHSNGESQKVTVEKINPSNQKAFSFDVKIYSASGIMTSWAMGSYYPNGKTIDAQLVTTYNSRGNFVSRFAYYYNSRGQLVKRVRV